MKIQKWFHGFTIVELLVTIAIIGILTAAILATLDPIGQVQKGRDAKRKSDLAQLQRALETYYQDKGYYPKMCDTNQIENNAVCLSWGASFNPYMPLLPKDDDSSQKYVYVATGDQPQAFYVYASLLRGGKDQNACNSLGTACSGVPAGIYCGVNSTKICNYGVSSSNTVP